MRQIKHGYLAVWLGLWLCAAAGADELGPPALSGLGPNPLILQLGVASNPVMTVTLDHAAVTDTLVTISSGDAATVSVQPVTIPAGQSAATFQVTPLAQGFTQLTATLDTVMLTATVEVLGPGQTGGGDLAITGLLPFPLSLVQGASATMTVTLSSPVASDTIVYLSSDAPQNATVPASVTVPAAQASVPFSVQGIAIGSAHISATFALPFGSSFVFVGSVEVQAPPPPPPSACDQAASAASDAAQAYATALTPIGTICTPAQAPKVCRQAIADGAAANKALSAARSAMLAACRPPPKAP